MPPLIKSAVLLLALTAGLAAAEPARLPTPADAVGWALADLLTVEETARPFQRYLWTPPWGNERWAAAINLGVNTAASHAATIQAPALVANGWLARYDLRRLAPDPARLAKLLATWDGLAVKDPYFHIPSTNTKLAAAVIAPHLDQAQAALLVDLNLAAGSIYRADWFLTQTLTTADGGAYYDFRQVIRQPDKGTGLDAWLAARGIFTGTTADVGGERRAAMFRSNVTGKPRRVDVFPSLTGGIGSITRDIFDANATNAAAHPIRNLLDFRADGLEIIAAQPNGLLDFLLTDAAGNIVDEAPPQLVRDSTIPAPHTNRLQAAISCLRCHGDEASQGWQPVRNDVEKLLAGRLNVFSDLGANLTPEAAADKLAGLYALPIDQADSLLGRARRDYNSAVYRTALGIPFPEGQNITAAIHGLLCQIYAGHRWDLVTPALAVRELGIQCPDPPPADPLALALGPIDPDQPADPILGFLRLGISVNRDDWEQVYADAALQAQQRRPKP